MQGLRSWGRNRGHGARLGLALDDILPQGGFLQGQSGRALVVTRTDPGLGLPR